VESDSTVKIGYMLSEKIATKSKPFCDGEFIKECMELAAGVLHPSKKHLLAEVSLPGVTIARRLKT
jgi:hypothetical protein